MNSQNLGGNYVVANFLDTTNGWITFTVDTSPALDSGGWFPIPVDPGMTICFSTDFFGPSHNPPPSPFIEETANYRVVTVDLPNKRVKPARLGQHQHGPGAVNRRQNGSGDGHTDFSTSGCRRPTPTILRFPLLLGVSTAIRGRARRSAGSLLAY
jgi:hypothetical protein